jgi:hypothetical protein
MEGEIIQYSVQYKMASRVKFWSRLVRVYRAHMPQVPAWYLSGQIYDLTRPRYLFAEGFQSSRFEFKINKKCRNVGTMIILYSFST